MRKRLLLIQNNTIYKYIHVWCLYNTTMLFIYKGTIIRRSEYVFHDINSYFDVLLFYALEWKKCHVTKC